VLLVVGLATLWWTQRTPAYVLDQNADQNILLITIDTLRADALGSYGGQAATPNLDALASRGAQFTFAHSHAVVTLPSHTSILTGRLPYEHGMRDNSGFRVKDGTDTLATRLKSLGFATGAFVGGFPLTKRFGLTPGFDVYDDQISEMKSDLTFTLPERRADEVVGRAVEWVRQTPGKFFGWVHVFDPHSPYAAPAGFAGTHARPYDDEVAWTDSALGPLLTQLATLSRPTTVIVTSDHGESLGEHGEETHGMFAYEATLRVPLIIATITPRGTGVTTAAAGGSVTRGLTIDTPARHIDIAPTVLDILNGPADATWLGSSLRPVIAGGERADRPSYFESMTYNLVRGWAPLRGVLQSGTKYIDQPIPEIYDLAADPEEKDNLAARQPERLQVLTNLLRTFDIGAPNRPGQVSAEEAAKFGSLGYVSGSAPERHVFTEKDDLKNLVAIDRDLHRASELFRTGRHADGTALLRSVIDRRPDTADAYISLAYAYWESGQWPEAIATLEAGLAGEAPDRDIRIRLGIYLAESRTDVKRAVQILETLPKTDSEGLNALGLAYGAAERFQDAIAAFQGVLALDPTSALANQNIATMLLQQTRVSPATAAAQVREAEQFARHAIDLDPALAKAFTTLGVIQAQTNRTSEAIESWKKAVSLDPGEFDALYNLVLLLVEGGRIGEALAFGDQYISTAPPHLAADAAVIRRLLSR
jgi:arylsulfatase A-like enzyme/cytochrome c-type biogenesis protein CcmH/NrfG